MPDIPQDSNAGTVRVYRSEAPATQSQAGQVPGDGRAPVNRQLPPGGNKIQRISQQTKGLFDDVTSWVDLKIQLTKIEMEERVEDRINQLLRRVGAYVVYAMAGLFALVALAMGLAAILIALGLSHPLSYFLGFLLVCILLGILGVVASMINARVVKVGDNMAHIDEEDLTRPVPSRLERGS